MPIKFKKVSCIYNIAVVVLCCNVFFELAFQYRFQTRIEIIYFFVSLTVSAVMIKDMLRKNSKNNLPIFYCFWPTIIIFISFVSECKFSLLPFVVASFIMVFCGKYKRGTLKIIVVLINLTVLIVYLSFWWILTFWVEPKTEVKEVIYSSDNRYVMVLEETNIGATGGEVNVYLGRNIHFWILGGYMPRKMKYWGHWGEYPELRFIDEYHIGINDEIIEIKGRDYIDDYYN